MVYKRPIFAVMLAAVGVTSPLHASEELARANGCAACHALDKKTVGPSWKDVAAKYKAEAKAAETLAAKVRAGGKGVWGQVPMPPQTKVSDADLKTIMAWVLAQ